MNRRKPSAYIWQIVVVAVSLGMGSGTGCHRETPPPENPLRQQAIGSWVAGRPDGPGASANLDLKSDSTFAYEFHSGSGATMKLSGEWTIDDQSIIGQVKMAENGAYKVGDTFPFGQIILLEGDTMKLRKARAVDEYHRSSPPPARSSG